MARLYCTAILALAFLDFAYAKGSPYLTNYAMQEYEAGPQIWAIAQDQRGVLYFANGVGISRFDGTNWQVIPVANKTTVRSLAVDAKGRVYAGGKHEFGYLAPDSIGRLAYHSLMPLIPDTARDFADVWNTYVIGDKVFFSSFQRVFVYHQGALDILTPKQKFRGSFSNGKAFYIKESNTGLFQYQQNQLQHLPFADTILASLYNAMVQVSPQRALLTTRTKGLYWWDHQLAPNDSNAIQAFTTNIDAYLTANQVYKALLLKDGNLAIGTLYGGVVVIDQQGNLQQIYTNATGLQDQSIYTMLQDQQENLWIGTNNGISKLELGRPFTLYDERSGLNGAVLDIERFNGEVYLATIQGVYVLEEGGKKIEPIENIISFCWDLEVWNNRLFVANDYGIFEIKGRQGVSLYRTDRSFKLLASQVNKDQLFVAKMGGLEVLSFQGGVLQGKALPNVKAEMRDMLELTDGTLWCGSSYDGLYRITGMQDEDDEVHVTVFDTTNGLRTMNDIRLFPFDGYFLAGTEGGFYQHHQATKTFQPYHVLNDLFPTRLGRINRITAGEDGVWLSYAGRKGMRLAYIEGNVKDGFQLHQEAFKRIPETVIDAILPDAGQGLWIGTKDGLIHFTGQPGHHPAVNYPALISRVTLEGDSLIFAGNFMEGDQVTLQQPISRQPVLSYRYNSVTFEYTAPYFTEEAALEFKHRLEGFDADWSDWSTRNRREYTNLPEGAYRFLVTARNIYGEMSAEGVYAFTIEPPWYRTWWAFFGYVLLTLLLLYVVLKLNGQRLQRANQRLKLIIDERTQEVVKQRDEIAEQQKNLHDSIRYALRIQEAILPKEEKLQQCLPESFIFFQPRDIVSGDFYWFSELEDHLMLAVADCTGHGVPGAFMSMIGNSLLNEIVNKKQVNQPAAVLNDLRVGVIAALQQRGDGHVQQDGMDIALCKIDNQGRYLAYAGAYNPLVIIRKGQMLETKADRMPIGAFFEHQQNDPFTNHRITTEPGDMIYLFSDGYMDQFGGPRKRKFTSKQFKAFLQEIATLPPQEQKRVLMDRLSNWQGQQDQIDDICVVGFRL